MPKRLLLVLVLAALAIAACNNGSPAPLPSGTPFTPQPNPSVTKAAILVTILGTPQPHVPVEESTPKNTASPRPGTPFDTVKTNVNGKAHFYDLKPSKTYCWVAVVSPSLKFSECAGWAVWQNGLITLGT